MKLEDINRKHILIMLEYCKEKWGKSKFNGDFPKILILNKKDEFYGEYEPNINQIVIWLKKHKTIINICATVIHEYTHYLQCIDKYHNYNPLHPHDGNYEKHPYELTARRREMKYKKECKQYLLSKI